MCVGVFHELISGDPNIIYFTLFIDVALTVLAMWSFVQA